MKVWAFVGILSLTYVAGAINSFFPSVVKTLGYDDNLTLVLTAPPFLLCVVVMLFNGWWSDRRNSRYLHVVGPIGVTIVALIIALSTLNTGARYFAMMLLVSDATAHARLALKASAAILVLLERHCPVRLDLADHRPSQLEACRHSRPRQLHRQHAQPLERLSVPGTSERSPVLWRRADSCTVYRTTCSRVMLVPLPALSRLASVRSVWPPGFAGTCSARTARWTRACTLVAASPRRCRRWVGVTPCKIRLL